MDFKHTKCNYEQFKVVMKNYAEILSASTVEFPQQTANWVELIKLFKRTKTSVGPYKNVSIFEGLNRIATDMVLLHGLHQLFEDSKPAGIFSVSFCLGNATDADYCGDFCIYNSLGNEIAHGEAFNAAEHFFRPKLSSIRKKWSGKSLNFIFCNPGLSVKGAPVPDGCELIEVTQWEDPLSV